MAKITLVTGGARSGKSFFAQELALKYDIERIFIATATPFDNEMTERIRKHQQERGDAFVTIEAPYDLANAVKEYSTTHQCIILIDCLTVWLGNLMYRYENNDSAIVSALTDFKISLNDISGEVIMVTNEVGMGIVPDNALARQFRDIAGTLNRQIAIDAETVYLLVSGIPLKIK